jgi:hypothetical protein
MQTAALAVEASATAARKAAQGLSPQTTLALDALRGLVAALGVPPPEDWNGAVCASLVSEAAWRDECRRRGLSPSEKPDAAQKAFARARSELRKRHRIDIRDGWVWLTASAFPATGGNVGALTASADIF